MLLNKYCIENLENTRKGQEEKVLWPIFFFKKLKLMIGINN